MSVNVLKRAAPGAQQPWWRYCVDALLLGSAAFVVWAMINRWSADSEGPATLVDVRSVLAFDESTTWAEGATRNVVLRARAACRACGASESFYRRLASVVSASVHARLVVVSEEPVAETRRWVDGSGMSVDDVRQWSDDIEMYPAIYMVDGRGVVTNLWIGQLSAEAEETVLAMVQDPDLTDDDSSSGLPGVIGESALARLREKSSVTLIDPRERSAFRAQMRQGAVNIPMPEWPSRIPAEFGRDEVFVVDCTYTTPLECQAAGIVLRGAFGYGSVYRLDPDQK